MHASTGAGTADYPPRCRRRLARIAHARRRQASHRAADRRNAARLRPVAWRAARVRFVPSPPTLLGERGTDGACLGLPTRCEAPLGCAGAQLPLGPARPFNSKVSTRLRRLDFVVTLSTAKGLRSETSGCACDTGTPPGSARLPPSGPLSFERKWPKKRSSCGRARCAGSRPPAGRADRHP